MKTRLRIISSTIAIAVALTACTNQNGLGVDGQAQTGDGGFNAQFSQPGVGTNGLNSGVNGTGLATAGQGSVTYLKETIGDTVLFAVDQSSITPSAATILDQQVQWLANYQGNILIEGHADEQGTREYNLALGARRAAAVRDYFVSKGIPTNRISVITYGKERPLAVCSTEECWSKNRRAVTVVN